MPPLFTSAMSLRCLFGRHRPMLTSILKRADGYAALCDDCGLAIERSEAGRWAIAEPAAGRDKAA
jgi:hypothetical protein